MGATIGQSYKGNFKVDEPDPDAPGSVSISNDLTDAEEEARDAQAAEAEAHSKTVEAERAAQADHLATMETSDPNNPQDANGNVAGEEGTVSAEPPPASGVDGQDTVQAAGTDESGDMTGTTDTTGTDGEDEGSTKKPYDPADHTAPEVREYLGKADARERKRVIAAEKKADKPRKGIVEFKA